MQNEWNSDHKSSFKLHVKQCKLIQKLRYEMLRYVYDRDGRGGRFAINAKYVKYDVIEKENFDLSQEKPI